MANKPSFLSIIERILAFPIEGSSWSFVIFAAVIQVFLYDAVNEVFPSTPPVDDVTQSFDPGLKAPPAKRLVIFIGDGLRSQSMYRNDMSATPHLRAIAKHRGVCGVSHASVPTESRSGHMAMLAGVREDLHSVTSNWKEEAIQVDHLFNHSSFTYAWGSPGVLVMFPAKGRVHTVSHHHDRENFAGDDVKTLLEDLYVNFTRTFDTLHSAHKDSLKQKDGLVLFLHMISTDLGGHGLKPYTQPYRELMGLIDNTVAKVEKFVESYFKSDGRTAYLFTADHGMTDWGMHGGGHVTETLTPVIAWGSGVSGPLPKMTNMQQTDLCPLMASMLGLPVPTNSRGRLFPQLLNLSSSDTAHLLQANVKQLLQLFELTKKEMKKSSLKLFFKDFDRLDAESANKRLQSVEKALKDGEAALSTVLLENLAKDIQAGLNFFHQRERFFHWHCLCTSIVLWIFCLAISALPPPSQTVPLSPLKAAVGLLVLSSQALILLLERRSLTQWLLRFVPILLFWSLIRQRRRLWNMPRSPKELSYAFIAGIGLIFLINAFYWRQMTSLAFLVHAGWVLVSVPKPRSKAGVIFIMSAIFLTVAPLLPEVGANTYLNLVPLGALCQSAFFLYMLAKVRFSRVQQIASLMQLTLLVCGLVTHRMAHEAILQGRRLPETVQVINWSILIITILIATFVCWSTVIGVALFSIALSMHVVYDLLSLSYEGFVLLAVFINQCCWVSMESKEEGEANSWAEVFLLKPAEYIPDRLLFRFGFSSIVMMLLALFGVGHSASVSSYDPSSVFPLYTIFRPGVIIPLSFLKVLLPLILTAHVLVVLTARRPYNEVLKSALFFSNILCFFFLCFVKDNENAVTAVGTSVGHYVIVMVLSMLIIVSFSAARFVFRVSAEVTELRRVQLAKVTSAV